MPNNMAQIETTMSLSTPAAPGRHLVQWSNITEAMEKVLSVANFRSLVCVLLPNLPHPAGPLTDMEHLQECLPEQLLGSFNTITCSAAIPFLRHPPEALTAWRPWLAPGGTLAFNAFVAPALEDFALFREVAVKFGFQKPVDPCEGLGSELLVTEALQAAGYHSIQVVAEEKRRLMPAESPAEYAEKMWLLSLNNNPFVALEDEQQHEGHLEEFHQGYVAAVQDGLVKSGRFQAGHVTNCYTVLHIVAHQQ